MKKTPFIFACFLVMLSQIGERDVWAQNAPQTNLIDSTAVQYAQSITQKDLKKHLEVLASDEFEGRETGTEGQRKAAQYLVDHFSNIGIPPVLPEEGGYLQNIPLQSMEWGEMSMSVNDGRFRFLEDYYCFSRNTPDLDIEAREVVFLGYGIGDKKYNDYAKTDVKGKILMVLDGEPQRRNGNFLITGNGRGSEWSKNRRKKPETAQQNGAAALLIIVDDIAKRIKRYEYYINRKAMQLKTPGLKSQYAPTFYISREMARAILSAGDCKKSPDWWRNKINRKRKPRFAELPANLTLKVERTGELASSDNVLAYIEGGNLKNELLVITAHYDHLGKKGNLIYNGADDDGSGTVALMEIAQAFAQAKQNGHGPRRSVLLMAVSGEEKGLLGSKYYTDVQPVFPLKNTVANLNIDMVGRVDNLHQNGDYVYIIGSDKLSQELHEISENVNETYTQIELDYKYNSDNDPNRFYYRSDHYNFAKNDIPVIFYFNGNHPDYHQPSDTVEKIDFAALKKRTQLVFYTAWHLANINERPALNKKD